MSYTKNVWLEHDTAAHKLTALNNLETLYTQAVSYIDAITHSSSYYTDAQAAAKFFTSATDGSGSGLIAATLDGYSADAIISAGSPSGVIAWWSGSEASIPSGWILCTGLSGTPDLRNRFVVGAGSHYSKADTGGANTVTTAGTATIAGHALTADEIAKHTHGSITDNYATYTMGYGSELGTTYYVQTGQSDVNRNTGNAGSDNNESHTHSASWAGTASQDKRPPFYALCYIMKS